MKDDIADDFVVRALLDYSPDTGELVWKERGAMWFVDTINRSAAGHAAWWNGRFAGKSAGFVNDRGYRGIVILDTIYLAHRIAWMWMTGEWPINQVDHINGIRVDNRWENLREVSQQENGRNQKRFATNTSGFVGVCWHTSSRRWRSQIGVNGRNIHLGNFKTPEQANEARTKANAEYGFHSNHGRGSCL